MTSPSPVEARVHSIQVSPGGVPKLPVPSAQVEHLGLVGDGHRDHAHHGGPDRAVCVWSLEVITSLREEGHPIGPGDAGENLTIRGLPWSSLAPGDQLAIGGAVVLELVSYTSPCRTIRGAFVGGAFERIYQRNHPGSSRMYARVLATGVVHVGDVVRLSPAAAGVTRG
jgi:MOSC domain-containing protein YiiM